MRHKRLIFLCGLMVLSALVFYTLRNRAEKHRRLDALTSTTTPQISSLPRPQTTPRPAVTVPGPGELHVEQRRKAVALVQSIYDTSIEFYGKVQDQYGKPVPGALVDYSIVDKYFEPGKRKSALADQNGYFSLVGVQGAAVTVGVSKEGYDPIYQQSNGAFSFGVPYDSKRDRPKPTKENPAVFVLRKKAPAEPLVRVRSRQFDLKSGSPAEVNLESGKLVEAGQGQLLVEYWANERAKDTEGRFDWKCRVSVAGGGLIDRNPEQDFEAPEDGYHVADELVVASKDPQQRWSSQVERQYFLKLADGRYARAKITIFAGGRSFFVLESYLNPSGSRNLE